MAAAPKETKEAVLDTELWIEMLYQLFNDHEIRKLAAVIEPKVQGFSSKNMAKAPPTLLRKKTIEQLKKHKHLANWLRKWFDPDASKVKEANIDFEQFVLKSKLGDSVTPAEAIALTGILYPEMFNAHQERIRNNLAAGKHPLDNLAVKKLTPKRALQAKALAWEDSSAADSFRMLMEKTFEERPVIEGAIKEWIQQAQVIEAGQIAYIAATRMDEISQWPEGEKAVFLQMAFHDSQKVHFEIMSTVVKVNNDLVKEDKAKEKRLKKLETQVQEYQKQLMEMEREHTRALEVLQAEISEFHQRQMAEKEAAPAVESRIPLLVKESNFILLTRLKPDEFAGMIPTEQIIMVEAVEQLSDLQLAANTQYLFVHSDLFSTKEQFELDNNAEALRIPFKAVHGEVAEVTRQLIYYLEGAIQLENIA